MPWEQLTSAAEWCADEFPSMTSQQFEQEYESVIDRFQIKPVGEDAIGEIHDRGAILLKLR